MPRLAFVLLALALFGIAPAGAQFVPRPPPGSPLPGIMPTPTPRLAPGLPPPPPRSAPSGPVSGTHAIGQMRVEGVTAFPPERIAAVVGDLTGPAVPEARIEAARQALVDLYRSQGYVYTTANAYITGDALRLAVVEGYVAEVKLEGDVGPVGTQVLRFLNNLVGRKPLAAEELERWLLLAQDIPGLTVRSTLNPSLGDPGVLTLVAQVSRKAVSGLVSMDNRAFNLTGPNEGLIAVNFDSFSEFGERTQLSYFSSFNNTNRFMQLAEELYLGGSGLKLRMYAGMGTSLPIGQLQTIGYKGETRVFGGALSYPVVRTRAQSLVVSGVFDALESNISNTLGPAASRQRGSYDSLRVLRAGFDYAVLDTLLGPSRAGVNVVSARVSRGLAALGAAAPGDVWTPPPRLGEKVDFYKFTGEMSRTQPIAQVWDEGLLGLRLAMGWQYAAVLLPPAEKFYLGGGRFNRGYYYGQVSGDSAVTVAAELQLTTPTPLPAFLPFEVRSQFYLFYDWGKAWQNTRLEPNVVLQSWGGGVRLFVSDSTEIDLEGVYRMNRYPNGQGPDISPLNTAAFYWQVLFRF